MLNRLAEKNVLTQLIWNYEPLSHEPYYLEWVSYLRRTHRQLYTSSHDGKMQEGFCNKYSTLYEPFALWMSALYGDGIYYCEHDTGIYFLIISQGVPLSGSDRLVSRRFWVRLKEQLKVLPETQPLQLILLNEKHITTVIEHCVSHQQKLKKRRQMVIGIVALSGVVILVITMVMLKFFMRG